MTTRAKEELKAFLAEARCTCGCEEHPNVELAPRMIPTEEGRLALVIDDPREGDQVAEHEETRCSWWMQRWPMPLRGSCWTAWTQMRAASSPSINSPPNPVHRPT